MFTKAVCGVIFLSILSTSYCDSCTNPKVTSKSFTTEDATVVTNIAFISEFTVNCDSGSISNLYADIDGHISPVAIVEPNSFQLSWIEDPKSARTGDRIVRLFDEDGYTALRKAIRAGEDISAIPATFTVTVNHGGAFTGPWLKSEFLAAALSVVVAYLAISSRAKLLS